MEGSAIQGGGGFKIVMPGGLSLVKPLYISVAETLPLTSAVHSRKPGREVYTLGCDFSSGAPLAGG